MLLNYTTSYILFILFMLYFVLMELHFCRWLLSIWYLPDLIDKLFWTIWSHVIWVAAVLHICVFNEILCWQHRFMWAEDPATLNEAGEETWLFHWSKNLLWFLFYFFILKPQKAKLVMCSSFTGAL